MEVHTVQLSNSKLANQLGVPVIDITVKSGNRAFAPTWDMVLDVKSGKITPNEYTSRYIGMMDESRLANPEEWKVLMSTPSVALGCYCKPGEFCHRHLLSTYMANLAIAEGNEVIMMGEIE
jgi:uncharacterized protein YeaO (DUF488 family)